MDVQSFIQKAIDTDGIPYEERSYRRGDFLCREGEKNKKIYLLKDGIVRAYVFVEDQDRTIRLAYAPDMIAVLDSFYTGEASRLNLQCIKATQLLVIDKSDFMEWVEAKEERRLFYQSYLERFAVEQLEREVDLLHLSAKERYRRLADRSPQILQEVPHKYIADYLRMSPETFSRLLKS